MYQASMVMAVGRVHLAELSTTTPRRTSSLGPTEERRILPLLLSRRKEAKGKRYRMKLYGRAVQLLIVEEGTVKMYTVYIFVFHR